MAKSERFVVSIIERQGGLCICGHNLIGNSDIHEVIIKRGDLPKDNRVFHELNCVAVHHTVPCGLGGHIERGNTKEFDRACMRYLLHKYGRDRIMRWIISLDIKSLPVRASIMSHIKTEFHLPRTLWG